MYMPTLPRVLHTAHCTLIMYMPTLPRVLHTAQLAAGGRADAGRAEQELCQLCRVDPQQCQGEGREEQELACGRECG